MVRILRNFLVNTFLVNIMMMAILLCCSSQVQAAQEGDYTYNVNYGRATIEKYTGTGGVVTIPSTLGGAPVEYIGDEAFKGCTGITAISIPQGVRDIGDEAFMGCTGITAISIPQGVRDIGDEAFMGCTGIATISFPQGLSRIQSRAFYDCSSLTSISIPQGLTSIGSQVFGNCTSLTSISLAQGLTSIGNQAFYYCGRLTSINIPQGVTRIESGVFENCSSLTSISIPQGITSIPETTFGWCSGLKSISLPEGITSIGMQAFASCSSLTSISLPQEVTSIGQAAFDGCRSLTSLSIPQGVTSIGQDAFMSCSGLTSISIPKGVTSIGQRAFFWCSGLTSITFNSATTTIYDDAETIPAATKIIGYDSSTAKDYAAKYNRKFEEISKINVTNVSLNKNVIILNKGANETLTATITPDNVADKSVTWSVSSQSGSNIATVSDIGVVTALNPGTAVIRATSNADNTKFAECNMTVTSQVDYLSNWHLRDSSPQDKNLNSIAYGNNIFVAVGDSGTIFTSPDGNTWTSRTSGTTQGLQGVTYNNNIFVTVGDNGTIITSLNGITWSSHASGTTKSLYGVTYGNNTFVSVGASKTILTSPDGITWTSRASGATYDYLYGVTYGNNTFVAVELSKILTSQDGITWTTQLEDQSQIIREVTYGNNTFVAVGGWEGMDAQILTSTDGKTWTSRTSGSPYALGGVTYGNNTFVAAGMDGAILTSTDGITWTSRTSGTTEWLGGVTYGNNSFVIVGDKGVILQSDKNNGSNNVATPTFNPQEGTYSSTQKVTIKCSTSGATIRYTTDGSDPTSTSTKYSSPITLSTTMTLKAKAFKTGMTESATASATYTINIPVNYVATPTFNPQEGTYSSTQKVTIKCSTSGATIRYTTDGSDPTSTSTKYSSPITLSTTTTLKAKAFKTGMTESATASATFTINLPTPTVSISSPANNATYTLGTPISIIATGTNCDHMCAFINNVANGKTINGSKYSWDYTPPAVGTYTIFVRGRNTAKDTDPGTLTADSSIVTVTVVNATFSVSGKVVYPNGEPMAGATVMLNDANWAKTTDANGMYKFDGVVSSTHTLYVTFGDYKNFSENVTVSNKNLPVPTIKMRGYSIKGKVLYPNGNPMSKAIVTLNGDTGWQKTTNNTGDFEFLDAMPGNHDITVTYNGYRTYASSIPLGKSDKNLDPIAMKGYTISGFIKEGTQGLSGLTIYLNKQKDPVWHTTTDSLGYYQFPNCQGSTTHTVIVSQDGYTPNPAKLNVPVGNTDVYDQNITLTKLTIPVKGIKLNKKTTSIDVGDNETLIATITPNNATNKDLKWSSSEPSIAAVDSNGVVTGLTAGSAVITVTTQDGKKTATCKVTVTNPPVGKIPVVFVPGTGGCFQADECNAMVDWYEENYDAPGMPAYSLGIIDLPRKIFAESVKKIRNLDEYNSSRISIVNGKKYYVGFLDGTYDALISELNNLNYIKEKNLFIFGYDTIGTSINENANNLGEYINYVLNKTGATKVKLIAHSQGNLVARKYIQDSYLARGEKKVNKYIMISPPNLGVAKAEGMLKYGDPKVGNILSLTADLQLSKYLAYYYVFSSDSENNKNNWYSIDPINLNKPWDLRRWSNQVAFAMVDLATNSNFSDSLNSSKGINALFSSVGKSKIFVAYGLNNNEKSTVSGYDLNGNSIPGFGDDTVSIDSLSLLDMYIPPINSYVIKNATHGGVCSNKTFLDSLYVILGMG